MLTRQEILDGGSLSLALHAAREVSIIPTPSLEGRAELHLTADSQDELDRVTVSGGKVARIGQKSSNLGNSVVSVDGDVVSMTGSFLRNVVFGESVTIQSKRPTLQVTVRVPMFFGLNLAASNSVEMQVGPVGGPLKASVSSSAKLHAEDCMNPEIEASSSAEITLKAAHGIAALTASGAKIRVESGELSRLVIAASVSGSVHHAGRCLTLNATATTESTVEVQEVEGRAKLAASISGKITLTGGNIERLDANVSTSGVIRIHGRVAEGAAVASTSGRIKIAEAPAGALSVAKSTSGTVTIG